MAAAACSGKDVDPEIFFDPTGRSAAAKRVCRRCPVQAECLDFGAGDPNGIWGGTGRKDRQGTGRRSPQRMAR
jgi:WhiB family redox-sensing transcriptional regulator